MDDLARRIRYRILGLSHQAHVGHIGSCLCVADILAAVYGRAGLHLDPDDRDRDRVVLGKGHAGLALYCALAEIGVVAVDDLARFGADGSAYGVHPERETRGIDFSSGSLGQGLGVAAGAALAARLDGSSRRVIALLSDAELNSGATWEAVNFAGHRRLGALTAVVDVNGQQALGATAAILDLAPLADRWRIAGWSVAEVDGHDVDALADALARTGDRPLVVLARTVFGRGVSFMEGSLDWHYLPMDESQYQRAIAEVGAP